MLDEGTLRERFPEIPWDQPVLVRVRDDAWWVCRYCIAMHGLKAQDLLKSTAEAGFPVVGDGERALVSRRACLDHIERAHHD